MKNRVLLGSGFLVLAILLLTVGVSRARQRVRWVAMPNAKKMMGGVPGWCIHVFGGKCNTTCEVVSDRCENCQGRNYNVCKKAAMEYGCDEFWPNPPDEVYCGSRYTGKQTDGKCDADACKTDKMVNCGIQPKSTMGISCPP